MIRAITKLAVPGVLGELGANVLLNAEVEFNYEWRYARAMEYNQPTLLDVFLYPRRFRPTRLPAIPNRAVRTEIGRTGAHVLEAVVRVPRHVFPSVYVADLWWMYLTV